MNLSNRLPRWAVLGLTFPLIFLNGWLLYRLGTILQPVTGMLITASLFAFLLDYPIKVLEKRGISRGGAIALVLGTAIAILIFSTIFLGPLVWQQLNDFTDRLPGLIGKAREQLLMLDDRPLLKNSPFDFGQLTTEATNRISGFLESATGRTIDVVLSTIDSTLNLSIAGVLSILLVINGERLWDGILSWFPQQLRVQIEDSLRSSFQGYFSGQATIAFVLATLQSTAFVLLNIPFGLLFGILIGLASVIPFGGTVAIVGVSSLLAFQDPWLGLKVFAVALVIAQINDNVLVPRLLGNATGLNPVVIVLVLVFGAKFAGFLGLILAVPTASFAKKMADTLREAIVAAE